MKTTFLMLSTCPFLSTSAIPKLPTQASSLGQKVNLPNWTLTQLLISLRVPLWIILVFVKDNSSLLLLLFSYLLPSVINCPLLDTKNKLHLPSDCQLINYSLRPQLSIYFGVLHKGNILQNYSTKKLKWKTGTSRTTSQLTRFSLAITGDGIHPTRPSM